MGRSFHAYALCVKPWGLHGKRVAHGNEMVSMCCLYLVGTIVAGAIVDVSGATASSGRVSNCCCWWTASGNLSLFFFLLVVLPLKGKASSFKQGVNAYKRSIKIQVQKIKKSTSSGHVSTARKFPVDRYTHLEQTSY
ncbi:hypothetical protein Taro_017420 [Colocasia esculenta]|uniref:Uncharacterized protein n=1 Tax=Colocasia esculenta TaxID=4460 RepID=A0A843UG55_COLES|nr:hypothetical protein [Colocasia esculenta]